MQITGDMTQPARAAALEKFQFDDEIAVFLLSLRSGSVGLTLTAANHLIMMERKNYLWCFWCLWCLLCCEF